MCFDPGNVQSQRSTTRKPSMTATPLRLGILGAAKIARAFITAVKPAAVNGAAA